MQPGCNHRLKALNVLGFREGANDATTPRPTVYACQVVADPDVDVAPRQTPHEVVLNGLEALFLGLIRQVQVSVNLA